MLASTYRRVVGRIACVGKRRPRYDEPGGRAQGSALPLDPVIVRRVQIVEPVEAVVRVRRGILSRIVGLGSSVRIDGHLGREMAGRGAWLAIHGRLRHAATRPVIPYIAYAADLFDHLFLTADWRKRRRGSAASSEQRPRGRSAREAEEALSPCRRCLGLPDGRSARADRPR